MSRSTLDGWSAERVRFFGRGLNIVEAKRIEEILGVVERQGSPIRWANGSKPLGKAAG